MRLKNKVAVITGGASGMGLATVMRFLAEGARVVIADFNEKTGETALHDAEEAGHGGSVSFIRIDVAVEFDIEAMLQCAVDKYGGLDIVFNNAGVGGHEEATKSAFAKAQPWPDYGRGEHIAGAALFLASDDSEFVTGEVIVVDGGLTAAGPELSKKFPKSSARNARVSGITKGSTGEASEIRRLDDTG